MSQKTYSFIKSYVQKKLDLQEETFISSSELLEACEEAVNYCEATIHKLNIEDQYFVACANIRLVSGQQYYSLPSNIYANKILRVVYVSGTEVRTVNMVKSKSRYEDAEGINLSQGATNAYQYMLINNDPEVGTQLKLLPKAGTSSRRTSVTGNTTDGSKIITSASSTAALAVGDFVSGTGIALNSRIESIDSSTQITLHQAASATGTLIALTCDEARILVYYIRRANVPVLTSDVIDFPEFWNFHAQHMIVACLSKELGNPRLMIEVKKLEVIQEQVYDTLSNMVPDQDDTIEKDLSSYADQIDWELSSYGL